MLVYALNKKLTADRFPSQLLFWNTLLGTRQHTSVSWQPLHIQSFKKGLELFEHFSSRWAKSLPIAVPASGGFVQLHPPVETENDLQRDCGCQSALCLISRSKLPLKCKPAFRTASFFPNEISALIMLMQGPEISIQNEISNKNCDCYKNVLACLLDLLGCI